MTYGSALSLSLFALEQKLRPESIIKNEIPARFFLCVMLFV